MAAEISKVENQKSKINVRAIVLAAGESRRMGRPKMSLPYRESTIIRTVVDVLESSDAIGVIVVLGGNHAEIRPLLEGTAARITVNPNPERGMLSSAQWALAENDTDAEAFLFALGDQPQIQSGTVDALIAAAERSDKGILIPTQAGRRGHPILIRCSYRAAILNLPDSVGLNALIHAHPQDVEEVPVDSPEIHEDIDTPEDYEEAVNGMSPASSASARSNT